MTAAHDQPAPPRPRARREEPEVRRQLLLRATITCLARLGPHATTGREICRQAGVSHSLLRHYFGNPQTLLLEAYEQLCDRFVARLDADCADAAEDPWVALERVFALHLSEEWAGPDVLGAWIGFWTLVRTRPDFAAVHARFNARQAALVARVLARLPAPRGLAPADAATIVTGVMDGVWLEHGLSPDRLPRARAIALCVQAARRIMAAAPA